MSNYRAIYNENDGVLSTEDNEVQKGSVTCARVGRTFIIRLDANFLQHVLPTKTTSRPNSMRTLRTHHVRSFLDLGWPQPDKQLLFQKARAAPQGTRCARWTCKRQEEFVLIYGYRQACFVVLLFFSSK